MTSLLAVFLTGLFPQGPPIWAETPGFGHFVECLDGAGTAYQTQRGDVVILDDRGVRTSVITCSPLLRALYRKTDGTLVGVSKGLLQNVSSDGTKPLLDDGLETFAQGERLFVRGRSLTYVGPGPAYSTSTYDSFAGMGISRDGQTIVVLSNPVRTPHFTVARLHSKDWLTESFIRTPTLDFGTCSIVSGFNDLLFLTPNVVAFIGEPSFELGVDAKVVAQYGSKAIQIGERAPAASQRGTQSCHYLFAMRLKEGYALPVARINLNGRTSGERGSGATGSMTVSGDGRFLFLEHEAKIWRFGIKELLSNAGVKDN